LVSQVSLLVKLLAEYTRVIKYSVSAAIIMYIWVVRWVGSWVQFLANVNVVARPSVVCLSVCLSLTLVHPTRAVINFGNFSTALVPWSSTDTHRKFYGDRPRGTPPSGELNLRGVAKYSDFKPIEGYISETVQDTR